MSKEEVKQLLADHLRGKQGLKGVELASQAAHILGKESFHEVIEELIVEGKVVEIEYSVPSIPYRLKSFFLPEGSVVHRVRGQRDLEDVESCDGSSCADCGGREEVYCNDHGPCGSLYPCPTCGGKNLGESA